MSVRSLSQRALTGPQLELLGFLAGERECPNSVRPSMYAALLGLGLIERGEACRRFYVTELGHRELTHLHRAQCRTTHHR
jgi:hypothetical protein